MFAYTLKCGACGALVDFPFRSVIEYEARLPKDIKALEKPRKTEYSLVGYSIHDHDEITASAYSKCPRCDHPALILYRCSRKTHTRIQEIIDGKLNCLHDGDIVTIKTIYPEPRKADDDPLWPDKVRSLLRDAQDCLAERRSPSMIVTTCRSVLELTVKELDSTPKLSLHDRINALHAKGVITSSLKDWAHEIRIEGNDAVHDGAGDHEEAREFIEFLKMFLEMTFSLPVRIEQKRKMT